MPADMRDIPVAASLTRAAPTRRALVFGSGAAVFFVDVVTKSLAVGLLEPGRTVPLIGNTVVCVLTRNAGAALSMAAGRTVLLTVVVLAVVVAVGWLGCQVRSLWWAPGLGMILGGAAGNLVDRVFRGPDLLRGQVVDFVAIGWGPVFNIADLAILGGVLYLIMLSLFGFPFGTTNRKSGLSAGYQS